MGRSSTAVQLIPDDPEDQSAGWHEEVTKLTFGGLREWERIGGLCAKCTHQGWLNKYEWAKAKGATPLVALQPHLLCSRCDNREGNKFILGRMARD